MLRYVTRVYSCGDHVCFPIICFSVISVQCMCSIRVAYFFLTFVQQYCAMCVLYILQLYALFKLHFLKWHDLFNCTYVYIISYYVHVCTRSLHLYYSLFIILFYSYSLILPPTGVPVRTYLYTHIGSSTRVQLAVCESSCVAACKYETSMTSYTSYKLLCEAATSLKEPVSL